MKELTSRSTRCWHTCDNTMPFLSHCILLSIVIKINKCSEKTSVGVEFK
jgi:hypothetical protein